MSIGPEIFFIGIVVVGIFVSAIVGLQIAKRKFRDAFGFSLKDEVTYDRQEVIDVVLRSLACAFMNLCNAERDMLRKKPFISLDEKEKHEIELSNLQEEVRQAKSAFWGARGLAKRFGFEVREKVGDYASVIPAN